MKKILTIAAVIATLLLAGCSQVGAAATVGDIKITQATVQGSIDGILSERTKVDTSQMQLETGETLVRNQLQFQLLIAGFTAVAEDLKIEITNSEVASRRAEIVEQVGGEELLPQALVAASIAPQDLEPYLRAILVTEKIGQALAQTGFAEEEIQPRIQELFVEKVNELKINVNPRYGTWDATTGQIIASVVASDAVTPSTE